MLVVLLLVILLLLVLPVVLLLFLLLLSSCLFIRGVCLRNATLWFLSRVANLRNRG